jgi:hypothetical protein
MNAPPLPSRWEFEDELTPSEKAEALALFKPGKLHGPSLRGISKQAQPGTPTPFERPSRVPTREPLVTPLQVVGGLAVVTGAFFIGRWWARRQHKAQPASPVRLHGLDVFAAS